MRNTWSKHSAHPAFYIPFVLELRYADTTVLQLEKIVGLVGTPSEEMDLPPDRGFEMIWPLPADP